MRNRTRTALWALCGVFLISGVLTLTGCENGVLKFPGIGPVDVGAFLSSPEPEPGTDPNDPRAVAVNTSLSAGAVACAGAVMQDRDLRDPLRDSTRLIKSSLRGTVSVTDLDFAFRGVGEPAFRLAGQLLVQQLTRAFSSTGIVPNGTTGMAMVYALIDGCQQALVIEPESLTNESINVSLQIQLRF